MSDHDDLIPLLDDGADSLADTHVWRLLVVDDDASVHTATSYALSRAQIFGRRLEIEHVYSAAEARALLNRDRDFAVILLDVVMETEDAGLEMVGFIRETLGMDQVRIILRTGQPGYAPELVVFNHYDINDYRTKSDLTQTRLITSITAAIRSYSQIHVIAENRRGLELILHAASNLMELHAMSSFSEGVLTQAAALLRLPADGIVCAQRGSPIDDRDACGLYVVGATSRFAEAIAQPLNAVGDPVIVAAIEACMAAKEHRFDDRQTVIYLKSGTQEGAVYVKNSEPLSEIDRKLLEVFASNIAACFGNVRLVEKLNFMAFHDGLTALPNRTAFLLELDCAAAGKKQSVVALLDLQHFADLNDGLGHEAGNALLVAVARRLKDSFGEGCYVARVGTDVFGVIGDEARVNPEFLFAIFSQVFVVGEHRLPVSIVVGFCRILEGERSGLVLLKQASIALSRVKSGFYADYTYFKPDMEDNMRWRLEIIHDLRSAFAAGKLEVWYQPQVALEGGQLTGIEALLRWPGDAGKFIQPPDVFIPLAEYSGLIVELGEWVLQQSCRAFVELRALPNAPQQVAVNVSMPQFRSSGFAALVARTMVEHGMAPGSLELEVTESMALDEPKLVISILQALKTIGVKVAIDDFGTGYSSLAHLRELPVDCLKIDRAFVTEITAGQGGMFAETIVKLGHNLGMTILAEGVETREQACFLRGVGCNTAQGYLYAKPMPLLELKRWMASLPEEPRRGALGIGKSLA